MRLQVHREFVHRCCIQLPDVVVGCDYDAVGDCGAAVGSYGTDEDDASAEVGGVEFLANVVRLGEVERMDDRTLNSMGLGPGGEDQSRQSWDGVTGVRRYASLLANGRA